MDDPSAGHDRRRFLIGALTATAGAGAASAPGSPLTTAMEKPTFAGIDDLGLDDAERASLEAFSEVVLRDVATLAELPLDGVDPAFIFVPRR